MNLRRVLGTAGLALLVLGTLDLAAGFGYSFFSPRGAPATVVRAPSTPMQAARSAVARAQATPSDVIALAFYTQNRRFRIPPHFDFERLPGPARQQVFSFEGAPRWVERGVLAFDHDPGTCFNEVGKKLHVFAIEAQARQFFALGFFLWQNRKPGADRGPSHTQITCSLGTSRFRFFRYHPKLFGPFDATVRRSRLEYAAHAELRDLPRASYPPHDKTMLPVTIRR